MTDFTTCPSSPSTSAHPVDAASSTSSIPSHLLLPASPLSSTVRFYSKVRVLLIPCRAEYHERNMGKDLWYTEVDFIYFKQDYAEEVQHAVLTKGIDYRVAMKHLNAGAEEDAEIQRQEELMRVAAEKEEGGERVLTPCTTAYSWSPPCSPTCLDTLDTDSEEEAPSPAERPVQESSVPILDLLPSQLMAASEHLDRVCSDDTSSEGDESPSDYREHKRMRLC